MRDFLEELAWRGLLYGTTPNLESRLARGPVVGYIGFDPTSPSLQIGNLVPVMLLAHLQASGGTPIVLVGGGTGMIGDPSGKRAERPLLTMEDVAANVAGQRAQLERFLDFSPDRPNRAIMLDNADWLGRLQLVDFLRDVGKHFTISLMLQKESVKARLESGISYTEFSYMLLQAYDFLHLYRTHHCELQMGGSDQWGNITAGVELIRRIAGGEAHGVCAPLITTASGQKFGKTEAGTVWLDPDRTSPYQFYQFWINVDDRDVESLLKKCTVEYAQHDIMELMRQHHAHPNDRIPHKALASAVTARVHGEQLAQAVEAASRVRFGDLDPNEAPAETWHMLSNELPGAPLPAGFGPETPAIDLVISSGVVKSKGEARRLIEQGGIYINNQRVTDSRSSGYRPLPGGYFWVRRGKKTDAILFPSST